MPENKVWGAPGGGIYHTHILSLQRLISGKKRSNLTWNGPVYHSYIRSLHFIHQSLLWCLISLVTQERPTLHIIKDWWGVLVKDRGGREKRRELCVNSLSFQRCWLCVAWPFAAQCKHHHCDLQMLCQASPLHNLKIWPWGETCKCSILRSIRSHHTQEAQDEGWAFHLLPSAFFLILPCNGRQNKLTEQTGRLS